jgi:DNA-binding NarL/FixJ family response regulator
MSLLQTFRFHCSMASMPQDNSGQNKYAARSFSWTMHGEALLAKEAFRAGASAYLLKRSASKELIMAIREALRDRRYVTPLIAEDGITFLIEADRHSERSTASLTGRKREVLQLIAEGRVTKEIAAILNISTRTVEAHKYEMMRAFGVRTTAELVLRAIKLALVSVPHAHPDPSQ